MRLPIPWRMAMPRYDLYRVNKVFSILLKLSVPSNTTKATLWIESRKTSPRRKVQVVQNVRRTLSAKKSTPLRLAVLKKAQSAHKLKVVKIEAPLKIGECKLTCDFRLVT